MNKEQINEINIWLQQLKEIDTNKAELLELLLADRSRVYDDAAYGEFFERQVNPALGPASWDIIHNIQQRWLAQGNSRVSWWWQEEDENE